MERTETETAGARCRDDSCARGVGTCPPCLIVWGAVALYLLVTWLS